MFLEVALSYRITLELNFSACGLTLAVPGIRRHSQLHQLLLH